MDFTSEVRKMLDEVLHLNGRAKSFSEKTELFGSVPELDSMAVIAIITAIEKRFQCTVLDDEIDGAIFATVGSLSDFVRQKVNS